MTKSQEKTVARLSGDGWKYDSESSFSINGRQYSTVRMSKGDEKVDINFRGGFKGLATAKK